MINNLVRETSVSPGTGTSVTLAGPTAGRVTFLQGFGAGALCYYAITDGTQTEFQQGTVQGGTPATLTRGTPLWTSTGSASRLNFTGTVTVYCALPSQRAVWKDNNNNLTAYGSGVYANAFVATVGGQGGAAIYTGGPQPGHIAFTDSAGTRVGYIGSSDGAARINLSAEVGWGWRVFGASFSINPPVVAEGTLSVNGTLWANGAANLQGAVGVGGTLSVTGHSGFGGNLSVGGGFYPAGPIVMSIGQPLYLYSHSGASAAYWLAENGTGHVILTTGTGGLAQRIIAYAYGGGWLQGWWNADGFTSSGNEVLHLGMGPHAIGSYVEAQCWSAAGYGEAKAGGELKPSDSSGSGGGSLGGTWRCMGQCQGNGVVTLWQRIA